MKEQTNGERFDEFMNLVKGNENIEQFSLYEHKETITSADTITPSPTEIPDKEIKKYSVTAVEWIISQYIKDGFFKKGVYEQAMEMERKQILDAFSEGASDGYWGEGSSNKEKYYNETYGSNKGV